MNPALFFFYTRSGIREHSFEYIVAPKLQEENTYRSQENESLRREKEESREKFKTFEIPILLTTHEVGREGIHAINAEL